MVFCPKGIIEFLKFIFIITITHLYVYICAVVYTRLEAHPHPSGETVDSFLINLKNGHYVNEDITTTLEKYRSVKIEEEQLWFQNFPKTFVYVLAAHTTLGNRHMNVKTKNAQLFYFFTVPLGVLLYYLMIHFVATKLAHTINNASTLIWQRKDDPVSERARDIFERLKLSMTVIVFTLILIVCFASVSLIEDRSFVGELVQIIDILYTITSSEKFFIYELNHDIANAILTSIIYFVLILSAYLTSYTIITIFTHHQTRDVFGFIFGGWVYQYFSDEDENDKTSNNIWDGYKTVPLRETRHSDISIESNTTWLHNDGNLDMDTSKLRSNKKNDKVEEKDEYEQ